MNEIHSAAARAVPSAAASKGSLDEHTARELLRITRQMLTAAHADEWEKVELHDASRRELLRKAPEVTRDPLPDTLTEALIAADTAVLERARRARETAVDDTHRVRTERDARDTYTRVMTDGIRSGT